MRKLIFIAIVAAAVMTLTVARDLSDSERLRFGYFAMEGMKERQKGNTTAAIDLFRHALKINPDADELIFALADYYDGVDDTLYLSLLRRAIEINPTNTTYQTSLASHYIKTGDYAEAARLLEEKYSKGIDKAGTLDVLVRLYYATGDYDKTLSALTRLETKEGKSLATTLQRIQVYEQKGDTLASYEALKSLADDNDDMPSYKTMLGNWLMQKGRSDEARPYLEAATRQAPDDYDALMSLYDCYNAAGEDSLSREIADRVLRSANTPAKDRARFMGSCLHSIYNQKEDGDTAATFRFLDRMLADNPSDSLAAYFRVSLMGTLDFPSDTIARAMEQYFAIVPDDPEMRLRQAQLYATSGDWQQTLQSTRLGLEYNPDELVFYYLNAVSLVQLDRSHESIGVLKNGLRKRGSGVNNELVADCYAILGDMLHEDGHTEEAFAAYDSCLAYNPKETAALNNYAYYLSLEERELKKAEAMSYQTVAEQPNNATYLDTYAWILFQQGRYDDAQTYIDRTLEVMANDARDAIEDERTIYSYDSISADTVVLADSIEFVDSLETADITDTIAVSPEEIREAVLSNPSNATLFEHAGDISYMNGHADQALRHWQDAAICKKPGKTLRKKIKKRKYYKK